MKQFNSTTIALENFLVEAFPVLIYIMIMFGVGIALMGMILYSMKKYSVKKRREFLCYGTLGGWIILISGVLISCLVFVGDNNYGVIMQESDSSFWRNCLISFFAMIGLYFLVSTTSTKNINLSTLRRTSDVIHFITNLILGIIAAYMVNYVIGFSVWMILTIIFVSIMILVSVYCLFYVHLDYSELECVSREDCKDGGVSESRE